MRVEVLRLRHRRGRAHFLARVPRQTPQGSEGLHATGLAYDEVTRLLDAADADSPRATALVTLLTYNGLRIDEALSANVADYTHNFGHRVLRITRKGGDVATAPLNPIIVRALDAYLADDHPPAGALFLNSAGTTRLPYIGA